MSFVFKTYAAQPAYGLRNIFIGVNIAIDIGTDISIDIGIRFLFLLLLLRVHLEILISLVRNNIKDSYLRLLLSLFLRLLPGNGLLNKQYGQTSQSTQYTVIQTTIPATTVFGTTVVTSTESPTGIAGLQANADDPSSSSSLSTGTKAGIGAGVAVAVIAAAIIGAIYAMRRRRRHNAAIASHDSYAPSLGNSMNFGYAGAAVGKTTSRYTDSEIPSDGHSPPMRESNPLDRYTVPGAGAKRSSLPANSRTSDISSASGSEPTAYRPGPGMPAVAEQRSRSHFVEELPEQNNEYLHPRSNWPAGVGAAAVAPSGDPFQHREGGDTPSLYSNDGDRHRDPSPAHQADRDRERQVSPAALELSGENGMNRSGSGGSAGAQGYRGMDPEVPYHSRGQAQLVKPQEGRKFDPSHNF
ncbi:hypothetical protein PMZ80_002082 [Knufia obscura]|uniref:Uncharacterized protein n=1 Tax=Knufia obscura TaxID=1635080 RepID=A0ABR0RWD2_9EURO|nr:hypothetical protein PMZ80_002082 [Knufia obscura]